MNYTYFILLSVFILLCVCGEIKNLSFADDVMPILREHCVDCHSADVQEGEISLDSYRAVISARYKKHATAMVVAGNPKASRLFIVVNTKNEAMRMPPAQRNEERLNDTEIEKIKVWIKEGALDN